MARKAIDGLQKLSGIWKHSQTQTQPEPKQEPKAEQKPEPKPVKAKKESQYTHYSQSGTGITLDLSKEIQQYTKRKRENSLRYIP